MLCENLPALEPPEVKVAVQVAIDTGRRPEEICALPQCRSAASHSRSAGW